MGDVEARLRDAGVRVTPQRLAVTAVLDRARRGGEHLLVTEIVERCREVLTHVSPQTVYDCVEALTNAGIARRVGLPGSPARYESTLGGDHDHLVCVRCGRLVNVPVGAEGADGTDRADLADRRGFAVLRTDVVHAGLCANCRDHDTSGRDTP